MPGGAVGSAGAPGVPSHPSESEGKPVSTARRGTDAELKRRASAHAHYANGVILELQNSRARSLAEFRQAALLAPEDEDLVWEVSRKFLAAREPKVAVELLTFGSDRPEASGLSWARLSAIQLQAGDSTDAIHSAQEAIRRSPGVMQGHQTLFLAELQSDNAATARKVLEDAESQGAGNAEFLIQLSELYGLLMVHNPRDRDALEARRVNLLEQAAALPLDSDMLKLRLGDGWADLGQSDRAADIYQDLLETMPDAPGVRDIIRSKLTEAYLKGKDPARAREQLEQLLRRDPTNVRACYLLGTLAYESRNYDAARDYFRRVTLLQPEFEPAYYDLAGVLLNLDLPDQAEEVVAQARRKFPQSFAMELLSAMVHLRRGEASLALPHFTTAEITAQALTPERLTYFFYFQFAIAEEQDADPVSAERHLKKCLELNPDFAPAQNYLGYLWADRGEHLDEALGLIEKAVASEPANAAYLDSLGWVLFKLNRREVALEALLKAVEHLEKPDATVYDHLGDVYESLDQRQRSVEFWLQSYELDPTDSVREKLKKAGHPMPPKEEHRQP
jgi:tetratricopeptide (TPR) repeat protein